VNATDDPRIVVEEAAVEIELMLFTTRKIELEKGLVRVESKLAEAINSAEDGTAETRNDNHTNVNTRQRPYSGPRV